MKHLLLALILFITILGCNEEQTIYNNPCYQVECSSHGKCTVFEDIKAVCNYDNGFHTEGLECKENKLQCESNQHEEEDGCVNNTKTVDCTDVTPEHGIKEDSQVKIIWENGVWSNVDNCNFTCIEGYNKIGGDLC